jgi:hypothetical protein
MTTAKKPTQSLSDLLNKDKDNDSTVEENKETAASSTTEKNDNKNVDADKNDSNVNDLHSEEDKDESKNDPFLSPAVTATVPNKTPAELSNETADETAARYNIDNKVLDSDAKNPRVQAYKDTVVVQIPSGTHLHPDIAKDLQNYGISERSTDAAQVKRTVTETQDFAPDAEYNDKF